MKLCECVLCLHRTFHIRHMAQRVMIIYMTVPPYGRAPHPWHPPLMSGVKNYFTTVRYTVRIRIYTRYARGRGETEDTQRIDASEMRHTGRPQREEAARGPRRRRRAARGGGGGQSARRRRRQRRRRRRQREEEAVVARGGGGRAARGGGGGSARRRRRQRGGAGGGGGSARRRRW